MNKALNLSQPVVPFSLRVGEDEFNAEILLRHLAGKRITCAGRWQNRDVIAKIYFDPRRKTAHAKREVAGAEALRERGIHTAQLLHRYRDEKIEVLIFGRILSAETALARWQSADPGQRLEVLRALVLSMAAMHQAGLRQEDLHLGNFLFAHDRVYAVDGDAVRVAKRPVAYRQALDNLGLLFAQLYSAHDGLAQNLYPEYARTRGWPCGPEELRALQDAIERRRTMRKRDYLTKVFRSSSAHFAHRDARRFWVLDRSYDSPALRRVLADPDTHLAGGRILKAGQSSTVGVIDVDGRKLVMKRYNIKNAWHGFKRALQPTRAAISWRNAHALLLCGIGTPKPVALLEKRKFAIRQTAYFICEYVDAPDCKQLLLGNTLDDAKQSRVIEWFRALFAELRRQRIGHGDTKASNFLVGEDGIALIDLDALRDYRCATQAAAAHERDVLRFLRNWIDAPALKQRFAQALQESDGT